MNEEGYCGEQHDLIVKDKTKRVFIVFKTDGSKTDEGFDATFEIKVTNSEWLLQFHE